ncbi:phosphoenolpyruvate carboxylase, partial [Ameyamaea chiangmaiensis]
ASLIEERLAAGTLPLDDVAAAIAHLRDAAYLRRAHRLRDYVGGTDDTAMERRFDALAQAVINVTQDAPNLSFDAARARLELTRYAAVFTAHPVFALANPVYERLAALASRADTPDWPAFATHRRAAPPTLEEEFRLASEAILRARSALDRLNTAILEKARARWPSQWDQLTPRPIIVTSWVGYDTDGRTDIHWWDTLRMRLRMKLMHLERLLAQIGDRHGIDHLRSQIESAITAVRTQIDACPDRADPTAVAAFAATLIDLRDQAIPSVDCLRSAFGTAIEAAEDSAKMGLLVARAGFVAHGMAAAHTHVRLNATQLHNVARQRLAITDNPADQSRRRGLLSAINAALDEVAPVPVDFGMLLGEQATAARLMMTVAQITKHVDTTTPLRFLIAETESGFTLLCALWLARLFGIADHQIEISPLFETPEALEHGERLIEEALHSPHWRAYLRRTGKLCLQFGYSDSGRYVGQLAATNLVERLRLKTRDLLRKHGMAAVQVILFDTHGESIGRGAHPFSLADRLDYLSPQRPRALFAQSGIAIREESAFQGGDGYLLFGTQKLADATIATIAEHVFSTSVADTDPVYDEPDFSADFFATIAMGMTGLVADPGYAALLGAFGPSLIDKSGSRPSARQSDFGGPVRITHPSQLRAIPNNAILHQLGWCANTLQGLGAAVERHPDTFESFRSSSARFRHALDFATHAVSHSDPAVLRAMISLLDPNMWLDRASAEASPARRDARLQIMNGVERIGFAASTQSMFRRVQADHLALRTAWPDAPHMAEDEIILHALRLGLIERIWMLAAEIPYFTPRGSLTRDILMTTILCLDLPTALADVDQIFPDAAFSELDIDFHEPHGPRQSGRAYAREHETLFQPMARMFALVREISTGVMHAVGAFG